MNIKQKTLPNEIDGKKIQFQFIQKEDNRKAVITHYLQNYHNGIKEQFEEEAIEYIKQIVGYKNENESINIVSESAIQQLLFEVENVPFPTPQNYSFKFIDLFAGIGGFRLACQNLGGKCIFTSEWNEFAQKTYALNFGESPFGDITKREIKKFIPQSYDLLCAGFPCQPFSYAGLKQGFDETRGTLFFDILEILKNTAPKMFLLENVKGLKSHDGGKTLKVIESSLTELGYNIKWEILNSYDFGLPQYRERWYCVGFRDKVNFKFPQGHNRGTTLKSIIDNNANSDKKLKLTPFEIERIDFHFKSNAERVQHDNSKYKADTKKGKHGVFSYQKPDGALRFHIGDVAKTQIQEAFYACQETYAPTIIANRVPKLWDLQRKLSVLEAQRLQGFPDNFKFPVSDSQAYKQLGNSVAVPVLEAIIKKMLESIK